MSRAWSGLVKVLRLRQRVQVEDRAAVERETALTTLPIVSSYLGVVTAFYIVNALFYRVDGDVWLIPFTSALTAVTSAIFLVAVRKSPTMQRQELAGHVVNLLLYVNCLQDIVMEYQSTKLIYFALVLPIYATTGARLRVVLPGIVLSTASLCFYAYRREAASFENYIWVIVTALTAAFGMSAALRLALFKAVQARITSDRHRRRAEDMANFDVLTGLPNRRSFIQALDMRLQSADAFDLALIDLDGFKPVNDIYGHAAGDAVLIEIGRRLMELGGATGMVARLGGDEFAMIVPSLGDERAVRIYGKTLSEAMALPIVVPGAMANLAGSVGFFRCTPADISSVSQVLERADFALYRAKAIHGGATVIFDCGHEADLQNASRLEYALRTSDLDRELRVVFHPIYDATERRTIAFEALARWTSDTMGEIPPDVFIPVAERCGLMNRLTPCLLSKALAQVGAWPDTVRLAFNLSALDVQSPEAIRDIRARIIASGVLATRLEFEITETALLSDLGRAVEGLEALKGMGCSIALDDFGAGFSSFNHIHRLPIDSLKIDRSFVTELLVNQQTRKIVKSLVDLCGSLDLTHVVEGVETEAQFRMLRDSGARYFQGYLIARPMSGAEVPAYLAHEGRRPGAKFKVVT